MSSQPPLPTAERLLALIDGMAGRPVAMVADLVADRFITGSPKRISREAPVLILAYEGERLAPGGGANAIANVAALGGRPLPVGVVGDDDSGRGLVAALAALGVDTSGVLVEPGYRTPTKVRILGGGRHSIKQQIVRYDVEDRLELGEAGRARLIERLGELAGTGAAADAPAVAILSDYGYGAAGPELLPAMRAALPAGCRVLCDSRYRLAETKGADGATPNEEEAEALLGGRLGDDLATVGDRGAALRRRLGVGFLLITRGSQGMSLIEERSAAHLPVHGTDQVADVTGAGDTVIGAFALALAAGASPLEAALIANYAGGVVVMKIGTATVSPAELRAAVLSDPRPREELTWAAS